VLEARRAQSFPDDEILTGLQAKQWRIIGNSVARTVSLALGLSIGEACRKNLVEEQNLELTGAAVKEPRISDVDTAMNSFVSAREEFDQGSTDSAVRSERSYKQSLDTLGLKSSANGDDTSSTSGSTDSTDEPLTKLHKRRHNIFTEVTQPYPEKRKRLLGPASRRDPTTLWEPDQRMTVGDNFKSHPPGSVNQKVVYAKGMIHTKRPTWQQEQQKPYRASRAENLELLKRKGAEEDINESTPSESEDQRPSRSTPEVPRGVQISHHTKQSQKTDSTISESTTISKLRAIRNEREATLKHSRETQQEAINPTPKPSAPPTKSKSKDVITIDSDEDEALAEDDNDNLMFVSPTTRKRMQAYVPVNNSMFIAYERTHETMRLRSRRR
jgi:site-specific DNA-cytosine methylase